MSPCNSINLFICSKINYNNAHQISQLVGVVNVEGVAT